MVTEERAAVVDFLSNVDLFESIPFEGLTVLARRGDRRSFPAGTQLVKEGDISRALHIVVKGRVRLERGHPSLAVPMDLAELGPGDVLG
jgi:CRP-like cAMP-binding protein